MTDFTYSQMEYLIGEFVTGKRAERDRNILRLYYLDGYTYEEIAERVDMSAVQVGRIVRKRGTPILLKIKI